MANGPQELRVISEGPRRGPRAARLDLENEAEVILWKRVVTEAILELEGAGVPNLRSCLEEVVGLANAAVLERRELRSSLRVAVAR